MTIWQVVENFGGVPGLLAGTLAARPAPSSATDLVGRLYLVSSGASIGNLYRDNGTSWDLLGTISSVFGRTGAVAAANGDYNASQITNTPAGGIAATTVQAALNELDSEKATPSQIPAIASQAQADAGTDDITIMTPLKTATRPQKNVVFETFREGLGVSSAAPGTNHNNVSVAPGACWIPGSGKVVNNPSTLTPPSSTTLSASTWYYVYGYESSGVLAIDPLSTTAPAAPYKGTARTKTGDTSRRYLGAVKTSGASVLFRTQRKGNWIFYQEAVGISTPWAVLVSGASTTTVSVSCSAVVPVTSTIAHCGIYNAGSGSALFGSSDIGTLTSAQSTSWFEMSAGVYAGAPLWLNTSQAFTYIMTTAGGNLYVVILGYIEEV